MYTILLFTIILLTEGKETANYQFAGGTHEREGRQSYKNNSSIEKLCSLKNNKRLECGCCEKKN